MDSSGPREDMDLVTVSTSSAKDVIWIVVRGEVDLSNRQQLRTGLAAIDLGRASLVYLDLRLLRFCDSAGCRILVRFEKQAAVAGHDVRIHRAPPIVRKVMSIVSERTFG
jgi:anti-anti-sigma factor